MYHQIKELTNTNWHPMQWAILVVGLIFIIQGFLHWDLVSGLLGGFFLFQAVTNRGCLMTQRCGVSTQAGNGSSEKDITDVRFTELKQQ